MDLEQIIRGYLPQIVHMSLASSKNNKPWVSEVHFAYDDDLNLYFRSLLSRRHSREIKNNPSVAGNIIVQHQVGQKVRGVYFEGKAKLLDFGPELDIAYAYLSRRLNLDKEILKEAAKKDGHKFYKISVENYYVFDSVESVPGQKYKLSWKKHS